MSYPVVQRYDPECIVLNEEAEQAFRDERIFTKEELLASFSAYMDYLGSEEVDVPEAIRQMRLALCEKFREDLVKSHLPKLLNDGPVSSHNFYEYTIGETSISLEMWQAVYLSWEDGGLKMTADYCNTLIDTPCIMLSVEEFADAWGVKPATVLGWIRSGRLRSARKHHDRWLIPSLADRPKRGYRLGVYLVDFGETLSIEGHPFAAQADCITTVRDDADPNVYHAIFSGRKLSRPQTVDLTRREMEELEYALVLSGKTTQGAHVQYVPAIK